MFTTTTRPRARRTAAALAAVVTGAGLLATAPAPAEARSLASARAVSASYDSQVLYYTNIARHQHGLAPLRASTCVDGFAQRWSYHLARVGSMNHQSLGPIVRTCHLHTAGENLARSGSAPMSARQVVNLWMHSPGHRANILNRHYRFLGVDAFTSSSTNYTYVSQVFGG